MGRGTWDGARGTDLEPGSHFAQFLALCWPYEEDEIARPWSQRLAQLACAAVDWLIRTGSQSRRRSQKESVEVQGEYDVIGDFGGLKGANAVKCTATPRPWPLPLGAYRHHGPSTTIT